MPTLRLRGTECLADEQVKIQRFDLGPQRPVGLLGLGSPGRPPQLLHSP